MIRHQKHEREVMKALKAAGYEVRIEKPGAHIKLHLTKDGKTLTMPMPSSPTDSDKQGMLSVQQAKHLFNRGPR